MGLERRGVWRKGYGEVGKQRKSGIEFIEGMRDVGDNWVTYWVNEEMLEIADGRNGR